MKKRDIFTLMPNKDAPIFALAKKYPPSAYNFHWWEEKIKPRHFVLLAPHSAHRKLFSLKTSASLNSGDVLLNERTLSTLIVLNRNEKDPTLSFVHRCPGRYLKPGKRGDKLMLLGQGYVEQKDDM